MDTSDSFPCWIFPTYTFSFIGKDIGFSLEDHRGRLDGFYEIKQEPEHLGEQPRPYVISLVGGAWSYHSNTLVCFPQTPQR